MPAINGYTEERRNRIKTTINSLLDQYFKEDLRSCDQDIVNILFSQIIYESGGNYDAIGPQVGYSRGGGGYDYMTSNPVLSYQRGVFEGTSLFDSTKQKNIQDGLRAIGLGQVMGWNFVKGCSAKNGKCEIERICSSWHPEFVDRLCVNVTESIRDKILGPENLENAVLSQLIVMKDKLKRVSRSSNGYIYAGVTSKVFSSAIAAAIGAYLGIYGKDSNGTDAVNYSNSIVGGPTYVKANGNDLVIRDRVVATTSTTPSTNGTGKKPIVPAGC